MVVERHVDGGGIGVECGGADCGAGVADEGAGDGGDCHVGLGAEGGARVLGNGVEGVVFILVGDGEVAVGEAVFVDVEGTGGFVGGGWGFLGIGRWGSRH